MIRQLMPWLLQAKGGDAEALKVGLAAAECEADVAFKESDTFKFSDSSCAAELTHPNAAVRLIGGRSAWADNSQYLRPDPQRQHSDSRCL